MPVVPRTMLFQDVKKSGYKPWDRKMTVSGGHINVTAILEQ
jgi:hypothetical protein